MPVTRRAAAPRNADAPGLYAPAIVPAPIEAIANLFLAHLSRNVRSRVTAHLQRVELQRGQSLFHPHEPLREVFFPVTALVSLVASLESGQTLEVGLVGRDGFAGVTGIPWSATMACEGVVQIGGLAWRMSADAFGREMRSSESLYAAVGRFVQLLHVRCMQNSLCNMFHSAEQRCIRWLLTVHDRIGDDTMMLTHELIGIMLGVHRPTVSVVLRSLSRAALIEERRGRIVVRDRARLETACCECYQTMCAEQRRLLGY